MNELENINNYLKEKGFTINGDEYALESVTYNTININGRLYKQPQKNVINMTYIGDGSIWSDNNESESDEYNIYGFRIGNNDTWVSGVDDFKEFFNDFEL